MYVSFTGFAAKNITTDLAAIEHVNKDGVLPLIDIHLSESSSRISFVMCQKEDNEEVKPLHGAIQFPFIVHMIQVHARY